MIFLTATTDTLDLVTSAAATIDVNASYIEAVTAGLTTPTAGRQNTAITTATTTAVLAAPGASNTRTLKQITIRNKHATLSCDVTLRFNQNATIYELHKVALLPGETLEYIEGVGFFTLAPAGLLEVVKILASDSVHATAATFADITGLTHPLRSGIKYIIDACLFHIANATTTGAQFGYNIGAAPTAARFGNISTVTASVTAAALSTGAVTARDTAITAQTTGPVGEAVTWVGGFIQPSADGTFALRATSEVSVAAGLTIRAGSWMRIRQEG